MRVLRPGSISVEEGHILTPKLSAPSAVRSYVYTHLWLHKTCKIFLLHTRWRITYMFQLYLHIVLCWSVNWFPSFEGIQVSVDKNLPIYCTSRNVQELPFGYVYMYEAQFRDSSLGTSSRGASQSSLVLCEAPPKWSFGELLWGASWNTGEICIAPL